MSERTSRPPAEASLERDAAYERAQQSWGFPAFARDFPRDAELDRLVVAFTNGDYAGVREHATTLAERSDDDPVRQAARLLVERTRPDPAARWLFAFAAVLLVALTAWWTLQPTPH